MCIETTQSLINCNDVLLGPQGSAFLQCAVDELVKATVQAKHTSGSWLARMHVPDQCTTTGQFCRCVGKRQSPGLQLRPGKAAAFTNEQPGSSVSPATEDSSHSCGTNSRHQVPDWQSMSLEFVVALMTSCRLFYDSMDGNIWKPVCTATTFHGHSAGNGGLHALGMGAA